MICGEINIWPLPSIKSELSTEALTFSMNSIRVLIDTKFKAVDKQIRASLNIFRKHLQRMQRKNPSRNTAKSFLKTYSKAFFGSGRKHEKTEDAGVEDRDTPSSSSASMQFQQQQLHDSNEQLSSNRKYNRIIKLKIKVDTKRLLFL